MEREPFALDDAPAGAQCRGRGSGPWGAIGQGIVTGLLIVVLVALLVVLGALGVYAYYARDLPMPDEMAQRSALFKSTKIMDRNGRVLFEVMDPYGGRRTILRYDELPQVVIDATVATEDATFFSNPGLNPVAILKALYRDVREQEMLYGGSTITQQLVKKLFLADDRTLSRKLKEAILAAEVTRRYDKTEILAAYLNEVYFGNLAYGIGSAAETYFGKPAAELTLDEASLLVGLIQSPVMYDPYTDPEAAIARRATVLRLMRERGYITRAEEEVAAGRPVILEPSDITMEAPHMVMHVREELETRYGEQVLYRGGLRVYTTLDLDLQHRAEAAIRQHLPELRERLATNAALVALDPYTGDVLAMVGSADFYDADIGGQVNVATRPRQPGSTIKPLTYLVGMEQRGWGPSTLLMDVERAFPDGANPPYKPVNNDAKFWGPMSLRASLANSRNLPAVWALEQVGIPSLLEMAGRLGITSLTRPDYGLSLTLGGGDVTLLEMTGAYAALANGGQRVAPRTILRVEDQDDNILQSDESPAPERVLDPRHAYLMTHMLSDNAARVPAFGSNNVLALPFPAAVKTGTTNDYRDGWTVGYTPNLVVGVWVGNSDNTPADRLSGVRGAGPIWHDVMMSAQGDRPPVEFARPEGIVGVEVCPISGHPRTDLCPPPHVELFSSDDAPVGGECPVHHRVRICNESGAIATDYCPTDAVTEKVFEDYGAEWDEWARAKGLEIPPRQTCPLHGAPLRLQLTMPGEAAGVIDVVGVAEVPDFAHYVLEYGAGREPTEWAPVTGRVTVPVIGGLLARWDTRHLSDGEYTLRLLVTDTHDTVYEARAELRVVNAAATPPPTPLPSTATPMPVAPTATPTPLPPTPVPTVTVAPTATPTILPMNTRLPTATPAPTDTVAPTATPEPATATATPEPATATATPDAPTHTPTIEEPPTETPPPEDSAPTPEPPTPTPATGPPPRVVE